MTRLDTPAAGDTPGDTAPDILRLVVSQTLWGVARRTPMMAGTLLGAAEGRPLVVRE